MNEKPVHQSGTEAGVSKVRSLNVKDLSTTAPNGFRFRPGKSALAELAREIRANSVTNLAFRGEVRAASPDEWLLRGRLGATVRQQCVISLDNVTTRIDVAVERRFLADMDRVYPGLECPVPEDDTVEPLAHAIDLYGLAREVLLLELPTYPRNDDAVVPEGVDPSPLPGRDKGGSRPFAVLSEFRGRMAG